MTGVTRFSNWLREDGVRSNLKYAKWLGATAAVVGVVLFIFFAGGAAQTTKDGVSSGSAIELMTAMGATGGVGLITYAIAHKALKLKPAEEQPPSGAS